MRHCLTDPGEQMDAARGLNDVGREQAHVMRKFLKAVNVKPDVIVCSNFARAVETADIMQRKGTPMTLTAQLQPGGDASKAWSAILRATQAMDAKAVLIVTHAPLIYPLLQAAAFCFADSRSWIYTHGAITYCNSESMPQFRWHVPPKLAAHMVGDDPKYLEAPLGESYTLTKEQGETWAYAANKLYRVGCVAIAENLRRAHKAAALDPLIYRLKYATERRFRRQWIRVKIAMRKLEPRWTVATYSEVRSNLQAAIVLHDPAYHKIFDAVSTAARAHGQTHVREQLGIGKAREAARKLQTTAPPRTASDLEDDLDDTTDRETGNKLKAGFEDVAAPLGFAAMLGQLRDQFAQYADGVNGQVSRAETVAVTEVSGAYHDGGSEAARNSGASVSKQWEAEDDACEDCQANADQGAIDMDATFDSGDDTPPVHPNCKCSISYQDADE
jgi:phosphohistidine phosphatase SixA